MKLFSQRDPKWANKKLGFGNCTLGTDGCLVTSLAMLATYYGKETDPDRLNEDLKKVNGFSGALYIWKSISKIYEDIKNVRMIWTPDPVTDDQFSEIDEHLEGGQLIILEVDWNPNTVAVENHFVLLIGKSSNGYDIADPWTGQLERLSKFGSAKYAIQKYILYEGKKEENMKCVIKDSEGKEREMPWLLREWEGEQERAELLEEDIKNLRSEMLSNERKFTKMVKDLTEEVNTASGQLRICREASKKLEEKWQKEKEELLKNLVDQDEAIKEGIKTTCSVAHAFRTKWQSVSGWAWILEGLARVLKRR